jgi:glycosyl transferase family 28
VPASGECSQSNAATPGPHPMKPCSSYDIALLSDFRFPGGTSSAIAEEIKANAAAGYRTALVHLEASNLTFPFPINPKIRTLIDQRSADLLDPDERVSARLALVHNPYVMAQLPLRPLKVSAEQRLLVLQHPPLAGDGAPFYDVGRVRLHAEDVLEGEVLWAPVGPLVRSQFERVHDAPCLTPQDWYNVIDPALWSNRRNHSDSPVIGRHSRPDRRKWPDTREETLAAYPNDPRFAVKVLGAAPFLLDLLGGYPRNWMAWRFGTFPPEQFLSEIDFFVYYHSNQWVEAFGCTIAEAMASEAVVVLPPHFEALFGDAALYVAPSGVAELVLDLHADRAAYRRQAERGRELVEAKFSPVAHVRRIEQLIGPPQAPHVAVARPPFTVPSAPRPSRRILFIASNGVGMGHLTRLLAIAERCPPALQPIFATMSQGLRVVHEMGFPAEYLPDHRYLECDIYQWNKYLCQEIDELIAFYDASVVVFDCNCPYQGLIDAIRHNPAVWFLWCRRGMWRRGAGAKFIERERFFDAVLEPRDLAGAFDAGLTAQSRSRTRIVDPIVLLDRQEILPRAVARRELGLDLERPAVLIQLGSGNNYDYDSTRRLVLRHLAGRDDLQVVVAEWLMSNRSPDLPPRVLRLRRFPFARWFGAFDAAVSAVGYNSYHELIFAGLPTLFIPNENPQQDDQLGRARYADRHGLGICLRAQEIYQLKAALDRLLDPDEQAGIRARCAALGATNGAAEAARMVAEYASIRRVERPQSA